jgi:hypothetical protein
VSASRRRGPVASGFAPPAHQTACENLLNSAANGRSPREQTSAFAAG